VGEGRAPHPGRLLAERYLVPMSLSASELAEALAVDEARVALLLAGETDLDVDLALRLGVFFDVPAMWWLEMQARFDVEDVSRSQQVAQEVRRFQRIEDFVLTRTGARPLEPSGEAQPHVEMLSVSSELVARLRAQAKLSGPRAPREVEEVTLDNGARALVGRND